MTYGIAAKHAFFFFMICIRSLCKTVLMEAANADNKVNNHLDAHT